MGFVKYWAVWSVLIVTVAMGAACSKTATAPDPPPPPPPVAAAPTLSCVEGVSRATVNTTGVAVSFDTPPVTGGQGSVSVTCAPSSGETFPIGTTEVKCTATDSLNRKGECSFTVTVSKLAQLSRVRFLAFGDSVTAGEVSFPVGSTSHGMALISKQVVVPAAAYPTILAKTLQGRYSSQADSIVVANYGLGGEKAAVARDRFIQALNIVRPEVVLLMQGYNDIPGGADGAASTAASEVEIMVAEARNRGMRVFLATLVPPRPGGNRTIGQIYIDDYNNRMRVVASRQGAVLVDLYTAILPDVQRYIGVDGLHPNEAGYARIADLFFQAIQANLEVR
ncbi:MAG TPA: GDSL-type esterase/lipase family protein [Vicinamibacterales bacterium]|nr:GDSL-type esterase/lipase family protein [Vicinamibacterales bacterium]